LAEWEITPNDIGYEEYDECYEKVLQDVTEMNIEAAREDTARAIAALENEHNQDMHSDSGTIVEVVPPDEPKPALNKQTEAAQPNKPKPIPDDQAAGTRCHFEREDPVESVGDDAALACDDLNISLHVGA
jgi:hypothetical protein